MSGISPETENLAISISCVVEPDGIEPTTSSMPLTGPYGTRVRQSAVAVGEAPYRDAENARLVGEVVGNAGAGEHQDADRQGLQELIVALERRHLAVTGPVRSEDHLRDFARIGPA